MQPKELESFTLFDSISKKDLWTNCTEGLRWWYMHAASMLPFMSLHQGRCHKAPCNSAKLRHASGKTGGFLLVPVVVRRPGGGDMSSIGAGGGQGWVEEDRGRAELSGNGDRGVWLGLGRGRIFSASVCHIQTPFLCLIHLHGSRRTCSSDIIGTSRSEPTVAAGADLATGTNGPLHQEDLQQPKIIHRIQ